MAWYIMALEKYATFTGRASRKEFWWFYLVNLAITLALILLVDIPLSRQTGRVVTLPANLYDMAVALPSAAVFVRRLHDTGHSGWWYWVPVYPFIYLAGAGQVGSNQYGSDPKREFGLAAAPTASIPAGWWTDPTGRHERRYRDDVTWTNRVSDGQIVSEDPYEKVT
jgi:uncharacterized membrane protein YhaH (DUF805 family)